MSATATNHETPSSIETLATAEEAASPSLAGIYPILPLSSLPSLSLEDFDGLPIALLVDLRAHWQRLLASAAARGYPVSLDPVLSPQNPADGDALLLRYLRAERNNSNTANNNNDGSSDGSSDSSNGQSLLVASAAKRLEALLRFREQYDVLSFYRRGAARNLFFHDRNPGACLYFADRGDVVDRQGRAVLLGRFELMDRSVMEVANHLRAGMFVMERALGELQLPKRKVSYLLDLGDVSAEVGAVSGAQQASRVWGAYGWLELPSGRAARKEARRKRIGLEEAEAEEDEGVPPNNGSKDSNTFAALGTAAAAAARTRPGIRPHLPHHSGIEPDLASLKEAVRMLTEFYPEFLHRIYFYRPPLRFRIVLHIFRLWVDESTRSKFVVVPQGQEERHLFCDIDPANLPSEFLGGSGDTALQKPPSQVNNNRARPLAGDTFILDSAHRYDNAPGLLPQTPENPPTKPRPSFSSSRDELADTCVLLRARVATGMLTGKGAPVRVGPCATSEVVAVAHGGMDLWVEVSASHVGVEAGEDQKGRVALAPPLSEFVRVVWPLQGHAATEDLSGWALAQCTSASD